MAQRKTNPAEQISKQRGRFIALCQKRFDKMIAAKQKRLADLATTKGNLLVQFGQLSAREAEVHDDLMHLTQGKKGKNDILGQEFDRIMDLETVEKIEITQQKVRVFTNNLITKPLKNGDVRDLGKFLIVITPGSYDSPMVYNLTYTDGKGGYHHPHVGYSHRPCFGNVGNQIANLIINYDLFLAIEVLLDFLQTINEDDQTARLTVKRFPRYPKKVTKSKRS